MEKPAETRYLIHDLLWRRVYEGDGDHKGAARKSEDGSDVGPPGFNGCPGGVGH